jgi:hypothetical protein
MSGSDDGKLRSLAHWLASALVIAAPLAWVGSHVLDQPLYVAGVTHRHLPAVAGEAAANDAARVVARAGAIDLPDAGMARATLKASPIPLHHTRQVERLLPRVQAASLVPTASVDADARNRGVDASPLAIAPPR